MKSIIDGEDVSLSEAYIICPNCGYEDEYEKEDKKKSYKNKSFVID